MPPRSCDTAAPPAKPRFRIVVDPGHGGEVEAGASSPNRVRGPSGTLEKDVVLDIARRLRAHLGSSEIDVCLTRDADCNPTLSQRVERARTRGADAFVSLHLGDGSAGERGTCTFVHDGATEASHALAASLHGDLLEGLAVPDLGIHRAPMAVLHPGWHGPHTAACLCELGVLADPFEESRLVQPIYRQRVAERLGSALRRWLVHWRHLRTADRPTGTRRRRALVVGIDRYTDASMNLRFAVRDAHAARDTMVEGFGLDPGDVVVLTDAAATSSAITSRLGELARSSTPGDGLILYFAGRGSLVGEQPAIVTTDGERLTAERLTAVLGSTHVTSLLVIADTGLARTTTVSGSRSAPPRPAAERPDETSSVVSTTPDVSWLGAAPPGGDAIEHPELGHGLLTRCLVDRVRGAFDITLGMLRHRLARDMQARAVGLRTPLDPRPWLSTRDEGTRFPHPSDEPAPSPVEVHHYVPLVAQRTGMSCWAAGAAMLIGWRDRIAVRGEEVARGAGRWAEFEQGLAPQDIVSLARTWELHPESARTWTVAELADMLARFGPLWIGEADPELHVVVLTGLEGDGTVDGTDVLVADPWPIGRGERYVIPFRELMTNFELANDLVGLHAQVLHTGGRTNVCKGSDHADLGNP